MRLKILGSWGAQLESKRCTSFLVDDTLLLDAGGTAGALSLEEIRAIRSIVISHSHLDHIGSLPFIGEFCLSGGCGSLDLHALGDTIDALKTHLFNGVLWPDLTCLPSADKPVFNCVKHHARERFAFGEYEVELIPVTHTVPCAAVLLRWDAGSFLFVSDTAPTEEVWEVARAEEKLKGLLLDVSFPNRMAEQCVAWGHLSPLHVDQELEKLGRDDVPAYLYHFKPYCLDELEREYRAITYPAVRRVTQGEVLEF